MVPVFVSIISQIQEKCKLPNWARKVFDQALDAIISLAFSHSL